MYFAVTETNLFSLIKTFICMNYDLALFIEIFALVIVMEFLRLLSSDISLGEIELVEKFARKIRYS